VIEFLQQLLNKNPVTTVVVIDEVNSDNWAIAAGQMTEFRKRVVEK
jgi:4-oxalocrotonate tautomerase